MESRTERDYRDYIARRSPPGAEPSKLVSDLSALFSLKPPEGWTRCMAGGEPIFFSAAFNARLAEVRPIAAVRDPDREKALREAVDARWEAGQGRFLRRAWLDALEQGRPFFNEEKFGVSGPLDPELNSVPVHKCRYYDAFLTNIIPGKRLLDPDTGKELCPPWQPPTDPEGRLTEADSLRVMADDPGVSTLLLYHGRLICWRQARLSDSSPGLLVPAGSGSPDWNDYLRCAGDPDGFRRALICGMERELNEESFGGRAGPDCFETRLLGAFRWLRKAGKPEFIGLTRLREGVSLPLAPNAEEVGSGCSIELSALPELLAREDLSVPLAVGLLFLARSLAEGEAH